MKNYVINCIAFFVFVSSYSQTCRDNMLSKKFDFEISTKSTDQNNLGSAEIKITILSKQKNNKIQTIDIKSEFILKSESFKNCSNNKSYLKTVNSLIKVYDYDFGDFIIADFNFDDKEDLAIKREEGGNGGPLYNFYVQTENQKFILNDMLSKEMESFPYFFDTKNKILRINKRIDSVKYQIVTYEYFPKNRIWKIKSKNEYIN
ncbi:XAC2610-related protein [Flavobacterium daemonense]|uniref:XAC2610-related protein n=1 Tax=Flavobacterium daemonense TaxID=1393049 RepID=UPI00118728A0|nr:hypothetical protein [Flavobacterium daemonense]KAF2327394.1 hypothetical protein FND99_18815 [Flavobacterium daemonense]